MLASQNTEALEESGKVAGRGSGEMGLPLSSRQQENVRAL